jgi:hypothetical protein
VALLREGRKKGGKRKGEREERKRRERERETVFHPSGYKWGPGELAELESLMAQCS